MPEISRRRDPRRNMSDSNEARRPLLGPESHDRHRIPRKPVPSADPSHTRLPNYGCEAESTLLRPSECSDSGSWTHQRPTNLAKDDNKRFGTNGLLASIANIIIRGRRRIREKGSEEVTVHEDEKTGIVPIWQPYWLRKMPLICFFALFFCITITLPVLLVLSQRNNGIVRTRQGLEYLWRFGPTGSKFVS